MKESIKLTYRTECWIEQCIYEERLCARDEHPAFKPLDIATPIAGGFNCIFLKYCAELIV